MKSRPTATRRLPADQKRQLIFSAARQVIQERGFDGATMEEIARRARVGKGTLYNFFDSKEVLLLSLVVDSFGHFRDLVDAQTEPIRDPWERIVAACRVLMLEVFPQLLQQWSFNYQLWGFVARDADARGRLFGRWRETYREREAQIVQAILDGQAAGRFRRDVDASSLALILLSILDGLLHRAMFDTERVAPGAALAGLLDMIHAVLSAPRSDFQSASIPAESNR